MLDSDRAMHQISDLTNERHSHTDRSIGKWTDQLPPFSFFLILCVFRSFSSLLIAFSITLKVLKPENWSLLEASGQRTPACFSSLLFRSAMNEVTPCAVGSQNRDCIDIRIDSEASNSHCSAWALPRSSSLLPLLQLATVTAGCHVLPFPRYEAIGNCAAESTSTPLFGISFRRSASHP